MKPDWEGGAAQTIPVDAVLEAELVLVEIVLNFKVGTEDEVRTHVLDGIWLGEL